MNALARWVKFNAVGALGMVFQLTALALLRQRIGHHYLMASAIALELTLLHNFAWHVRYTWRDRERRDSRLKQLARFHLSNGMVSLTGNLGLTRLLVSQAHWPLVAANGAAILCCSLVNFCVATLWTFAGSTRVPPAKEGSPAQEKGWWTRKESNLQPVD